MIINSYNHTILIKYGSTKELKKQKSSKSESLAKNSENKMTQTFVQIHDTQYFNSIINKVNHYCIIINKDFCRNLKAHTAIDI